MPCGAVGLELVPTAIGWDSRHAFAVGAAIETGDHWWAPVGITPYRPVRCRDADPELTGQVSGERVISRAGVAGHQSDGRLPIPSAVTYRIGEIVWRESMLIAGAVVHRDAVVIAVHIDGELTGESRNIAGRRAHV